MGLRRHGVVRMGKAWKVTRATCYVCGSPEMDRIRYVRIDYDHIGRIYGV